MAGLKISDYVDADSISGTELVLLSKNGAYRKTTIEEIRNLASDITNTELANLVGKAASAQDVKNILNTINNNFENVNTQLSDIVLNIGSLFVNVKNYGAKGDGTADDTSAIQNALNALDGTGGICYLPSGTFMISKTLIIPSCVHIMGTNNSTVIKPTSTFQTDMISGTLGDHISFNFMANKNFNVAGMVQYGSSYDIEISNIYFVFDDIRVSQGEDKNCCIAFNNCKRIIIRDCRFNNFGQHSVDLSGVQDGLVERTYSYGGYWASIQVDIAAGVYQGATDNNQISKNITIRDNYITGNRSPYGAIQIHKNGGDNVFIENNKIEEVLYGITTDDYFLANWGIGQNKNIYINNNYINTSSIDAIGIAITKDCTEVKITNNRVSTINGTPLYIRGGKPSYYIVGITINNNYFRGKSISIIGAQSGNMTGNNIDLTSGKIIISCQRFNFSNNVVSGYGVILQDITVTDSRDLSTYTYTFDSIIFESNLFHDALGDGVTYSLIATTFRLVSFFNNAYFVTNTAFNFTAMSVTTGITIRDYFRSKTRTTSTGGRLTNGLLIGTQSYDDTLKKPIWWNGTAWTDATGTTV